MRELSYTALTDGTSDQALLPLLTWLLRQHRVNCPIQSQWADLCRVTPKPRRLVERIKSSLDLYPCDLLFIHRDAERESHEQRKTEILDAVNEVCAEMQMPPRVCVIPVRMQESWLLFDTQAIRRAAQNPNGREQIDLPPKHSIETLHNPKEVLHDLIKRASGKTGRRLEQLSVRACARRITEYIEDYSPLRGLSAFDALEQEIKEAVNNNQWS